MRIAISQNRDHLIATVRGIYPGGSTNLHAGLVNARNIFANQAKSNRLRRVFVFSDGLVNVGVTDHDAILSFVQSLVHEHRITTTSFGIGSDFDDKLMTA